jgi:hypothetical protein
MDDIELQSDFSTVDGNTNNGNQMGLFMGRVINVLLNEETNESVGRVEIRVASSDEDEENNQFEETMAFPLNIYNYTLPAINESVLVTRSETGRWFYFSIPPHNFWDQISIDRLDSIKNLDGEEENVKINLQSFDQISVTDDADVEIYGTTLTEEVIEATDVVLSRNVHEGDTLIQGRFGNSIKLTSKNELNETPWSLDGEDGQPVIAIRNGLERFEDPTTDNSFIYLLSDQSFDFGDIEFSPESANLGDTMDAYVGGQVIIGADRLTLLSKADDISISSKSLVSISTAKWAVDVDVLMDQVKALATQLDALCAGKATLVTGVGPTGVGTNTADCAAIVSEIEGMEQ